MLPQPVASTTHSKLSVDIRRFPWIRRLAADYAFDYARLTDFFAGNPTDRSMWLIIGGAVAVIAGIGVSLMGRRRP